MGAKNAGKAKMARLRVLERWMGTEDGERKFKDPMANGAMIDPKTDGAVSSKSSGPVTL